MISELEKVYLTSSPDRPLWIAIFKMKRYFDKALMTPTGFEPVIPP